MPKFPNFIPDLQFARFNDRKIINWFPGHMAKATKQIKEKLKYIDFVIEVRDARVPISSKNKTINEIFIHKKRLILFNKCDLISKEHQEQIKKYFSSESSSATIEGPKVLGTLFTSAKQGLNVNKIVQECLHNKNIEVAPKKFKTIPYTFLIAGVPNVGKSSIINKLIEKKKAKEGALPGVTRGMGFFPMKTRENCLLLDTPGIFQPDIETNEQGFKLSLINALPDHLFGGDSAAGGNATDLTPLIDYMLFQLNRNECYDYVEILGLKGPTKNIDDLLLAACKKWKMFTSGGEPDLNKALSHLLFWFRTGKLGQVVLDCELLEQSRLNSEIVVDSLKMGKNSSLEPSS
ncbi:predicted protein [Naegleria gruberi]|uniref:Predicted protein n=1 Tax=Naegleria gruberi TaxID=5762 RepID=D2VGL9_NAEGR|nr:uncharacterized protein NAEGRDRAFT_68025 [Naegleria gruberi]EFC43990.1 predicted protein [Naegleria gruberi]|eukprot:XP_002676734.1 predicted protein [Naegleria gruberi strain NEG-M]